jgi:hypothetical protein
MAPFVFGIRADAGAHCALDERIEVTWPDARGYLQSEYSGGVSGHAYAVTLYSPPPR